jgi:uncharacterized protein DUF6457
MPTDPSALPIQAAHDWRNRYLGPVNSFFDELGDRFVRAAARQGVTIEKPAITSEVAQEILELARVAAHTQERRFAPLASFVAGLAIERLGVGGEGPSSETAADLIREVRTELEAEAPATT